MKTSYKFLFLFLFPIFSWSQSFSGQQVFYSPFTQSYPTIFTTEIHDINRTIIFEPHTITITTEVKGGKEIEILNIEGHDVENGTFTFFCKSRNNRKITIAIPDQEQVEIIDYYFHSSKTNEETQLRFLVERQ